MFISIFEVKEIHWNRIKYATSDGAFYGRDQGVCCRELLRLLNKFSHHHYCCYYYPPLRPRINGCQRIRAKAFMAYLASLGALCRPVPGLKSHSFYAVDSIAGSHESKSYNNSFILPAPYDILCVFLLTRYVGNRFNIFMILWRFQTT